MLSTGALELIISLVLRRLGPRFVALVSPGGCNDIGATPGSMGAHGSEGDGGCLCAGLTVRGSAYLVFDTLNNSHAVRRPLIESLNFPPTLAFATGGAAAIKTPTASMITAELPIQIKLMTLTNNYAEFNDGSYFRFLFFWGTILAHIASLCHTTHAVGCALSSAHA